MYIQTDDNGNIIQCITVGEKPAVNGYEITDISDDILKNIFSYTYKDGVFQLNEKAVNNKFEKIKNKKIATMSKLCETTITNGIDYNGEHYSLTEHDQIMMMKLEQMAAIEGSVIKYHADDSECRVYDNADFIQLTQTAAAYIDFNRTYFNKLKADIKEMTDIKEIINVYYGQPLSDTRQRDFETLMGGITFEIPELPDDTNYEMMFTDVDISNLVYPSDIESSIEEDVVIDDETSNNEDNEIIEESETSTTE